MRFIALAWLSLAVVSTIAAAPAAARDRLTEPFLQNPGPDAVSVVWFTEALGHAHEVRVGPDRQRFPAQSVRLRDFYEDHESYLPGQLGDGALYTRTTPRPLYRHEARIDGLTPGEYASYFVVDIGVDGVTRLSDVYELSPLPTPGQPLKILLTSDHQAKPMAAANIRKLAETEPRIDAIFFAGDLVNIPGRASEWFDDARGASFFDVLQGRSTYVLERDTPEGRSATVYGGAPLLQTAPLFPALGNHEVMGVVDPDHGLNFQYNDPKPRTVAEREYALVADLVNPLDDPTLRNLWIEDASFNARAYLDIFTLPDDGPAGEKYYATRFGDVALASLYVSRIWRTPFGGPETRGRYQEMVGDLSLPSRWGHGAHIFEPISVGSIQYEWLARTLESPEFRDAPIKIVMLHHPPRGLGGNVSPAFTPPRREIVRDTEGAPEVVRYSYPKEDDILLNDLEPLLIDGGVDLVLFGHSHVWQRLRTPEGLHYLESSNVGNTYGCFYGAIERDPPVFDAANHTPTGDPGGLAPQIPTLFAPQTAPDGSDAPCVASNDLTVFTILDTATRSIDSYVYDTTTPSSPPKLFDQFTLE